MLEAESSTLLLSIGVISILVFYYFFSDKRKYPPGPWGLPYVGSLFSIGATPHITFTKWAKKYGPIVMVNLGRSRTVVINDIKLIREAFNEPVFSGRPNNKGFNITAGGKFGIVFSDGEDWAEQRRFALRTLRDFGFGKKGMETMIMEEVTEIIDWLKKGAGKPISVNRKFSLAVLNALWSILTSERYDHDDPKLNKIMDTADESYREADEGGVALFFPELAERFPGITGWTKMLKALAPVKKIFETAVEDRLKDPGDVNNPRDFMDVYINEINNTKNPKSSFHGDTGIKTLKAVIGDLHGAGSETTSTTLTWTVLYLMEHPGVQKKIHQEIDTVIGKSRMPCLADKPNMPYTEAVAMEVFRHSSFLPMGVFHNTMADTVFHGYFIPKDTLIIANHYHVQTDPETWGDPESFRPERFLTPDGKSVIKHESLIPFSTGKRVCLGETLARDEYFLFMTSIFQRFQVERDPSNPAVLEPQNGFLLSPKPFTVIMKDILEAE